MFVTQKKSKKEKKEIPCPADLVFLGDFTYVDYGREALTNYGRPNYGRTSLTIYGRETRANYGRPNYGRTSRAFMGEIKRQKRERVVSVLYHKCSLYSLLFFDLFLMCVQHILAFTPFLKELFLSSWIK